MMFLATFLLAGWLGQGCSEHQQRNPSAKKYQHHNKPKLHYSSHVPHLETKYGIDLPSFAFDYSEYFSGAVIERSSRSKDLYLTMFVMGHQAISTDFPFQAISTDEEVLHSWTKATKKWEKPLAESLTTTKTSLSRRQLSTPSNSLSQQSFHATYSSGLVCLLKNNDIPHSQVYQSTAYWVQSQSDMDSSSGHNIFSILRCKLRNTAHFYQNSTHITEKQLFADVMRMLPHKSRGNHTATGGGDGGAKALPTASADGDIARDSRGTVLSSFSVPWSTRVVGYPLAFHSNNLHPLFESVSRHHHVSSPATGAVTSGAPAVSSAGQHSTNVAGAVTRAGTGAPGAGAAVGVDSSAVLCVPGVRPLHPLRAEVGLPMLVEFVEHHLLLGYQHIVFGIALDWKSSFMTKHIHVLQPYIQAGKVSLYSTTLPGYDDVQGFGGIELNDAYAEQYFLNHCLYYAKGMASYVTVLHIDEFIIPVEVPAAVSTTSEVRVGIDTDSESKKGTFVQEVVRRFSKVDASNRSAEANGAYSSKDATKHAAVAQSHCTYSLQPAHSSTSASGERMAGAGAGTGKEGAVDRVGATIGTVQAPLWVYGVEDPANVFGAWGPGESSWSREFFAPSTPKLLLRGVHSVQFLPTDRVVRIEVSPSRETIAHCRSVASQKSRSSAKTAQQQLQHASLRGSYDAAAIHAHASGVSSGSGANSTNTTHVLKRHGVVAYTGSGVLSEPLAALFVYKGAFASNLFAPPASEINQEGAKMLSAALANRQVLNSRITSSLQAKNMSTILELKALVKQSRLIHLQALTTSAAAGGGGGSIGRAHIPAAVGDAENPAAPSGSAMKDQVIVELPTRAAIKPPFWQLCNTDYLKDVIKRVFHPV